MSFTDLRTAAKVRDIVKKIVRKEIDRLRPTDSYATVVSIDRTNKRVTVTYDGETGAVSLPMGNVQPGKVGQRVRVAGDRNNRQVVMALGGDGLTFAPKVAIGGDTDTAAFYVYGDIDCTGTKAFRIPHPVRPGYDLTYVCPEGPRAELIYRGTVTMVGSAPVDVDVDASYGLTSGTVAALGGNRSVWLQSQDGRPLGYAWISDILRITSPSASGTTTVHWMVITDRSEVTIENERESPASPDDL